MLPAVLFAGLMLLCSIGLLIHRRGPAEPDLEFSICIACRNEAPNLPRLFAALDALNYPKEHFEIIIVDDASTDNSPHLLEDFCARHPNASWYRIQEKDSEYRGKKAALKQAVEAARFEYLALTDADCAPPANWLLELAPLFSAKTGMVTGTVQERPQTWFSRIMYIANGGIYGATIGLGMPFSCAGGNLAIRAKAYHDVGGYHSFRHNLSGDDKQMLLAIHRAGWKIAFNRATPVLTQPTSGKKRSSQLSRRYGKFHLSSLPFQILQLVIFAFLCYLPVAMIYGNWLPAAIYSLSVLLFWGVILACLHRTFRLTDIIFVPLFPYAMVWFTIAGYCKPGRWNP